MAEPQVLLEVGGRAHGGWTDVTITRRLDRVFGDFRLGVTEIWPDQDVRREISPDEVATIRVEGVAEPVITGHVDVVEVSYERGGGADHSVVIEGRDATGDLVDCSAIHASGEWADRTLLQIAQDLCNPFGIDVGAEVDLGKSFVKWKLQEGETVFENLERAARHRGVLLVSDGRGGLRVIRPGTERIATALVQGENILAATGRLGYLDRFRDYTVKGQRPADDFDFGDEVTQKQGRARDSRVRRHRPLVVITDEHGDSLTLQQRADWERNVRAGRSVEIEVTVQGWFHQDGLWQPNKRVMVRSPWLRLDRELLIVGVRLSKSRREGTLARLSLMAPEALTLQAIPERDEDDFLW